MPCDFLSDSGLIHPFRQIPVADVVVRQVEQSFIVIVILRLSDKADKSIAQRHNYPAARAVTFRFLLLESERLCCVVNIAEREATGVALSRTGV